MGRRRPLVSVGLPVSNGEAFVKDALESLLAQTVDDLEIVVLDNASTDATAEIVSGVAAEDGRVRMLKNDRNIGAAASSIRIRRLDGSMATGAPRRPAAVP